MTNIRIFIGKWDHSGNKPVFKCDTGTFDENGTYTQFPGKDEPWDTTVDDLYVWLDENEGAISLTKEELLKSLENTGEADFYASWHGAHLVKLI